MNSERDPKPRQLNNCEKHHLREKLSVAIAERRHHDQVYLHAFVGGFVILGIYLVAFDGVMKRAYSAHNTHSFVFWGSLVLGAALAAVVYWHIVDQRNKRDICGKIADRVNMILIDGELEATELDNELRQSVQAEIKANLKEPQLPQKPKGTWQWVYVGVYIGMVILLLVILAVAHCPAAAYQTEEPSVTNDAEKCVKDQTLQDSAGIGITVTGMEEGEEKQARQDWSGI